MARVTLNVYVSEERQADFQELAACLGSVECDADIEICHDVGYLGLEDLAEPVLINIANISQASQLTELATALFDQTNQWATDRLVRMARDDPDNTRSHQDRELKFTIAFIPEAKVLKEWSVEVRKEMLTAHQPSQRPRWLPWSMRSRRDRRSDPS